MDKLLRDYLSDILFDSETIGGIQQRVFQDILSNVESFENPTEIYEKLISHCQYQIGDSMISGNMFITERIVKNLLAVVEEIYTKKGVLREDVLEQLLKNEAVIQSHYKAIIEFYRRIYGGKSKRIIRRVLKLSEAEILKEIALHKKLRWRYDNDPEEQTVSANGLLKLAANVAEYTNDKSWSLRILFDAYAIVQQNNNFDESIDLAELFMKFGGSSQKKRHIAGMLYQKAFQEVLFTSELIRVIDGIGNTLGDKIWAMNLLSKIKTASFSTLDLCGLAETVYDPRGFSDIELSKRFYRKALRACKEESDYQWVLGSLDDTIARLGNAGKKHISEILQGFKKRWVK